MKRKPFQVRCASITAFAYSAQASTQREISETNKKRQRHSVPCGQVAVHELAFEQMIYFFADGLKIIQSKIYNGITDVCYLVHFL